MIVILLSAALACLGLAHLQISKAYSLKSKEAELLTSVVRILSDRLDKLGDKGTSSTYQMAGYK